MMSEEIPEVKMKMSEDFQRAWRFDTAIAVTIAMGILANAGGSIWWASKLTTLVDNNSVRIDKLEGLPDRMTKVESSMVYQKEILIQIAEDVRSNGK
jgi:streptogramin lyase